MENIAGQSIIDALSIRFKDFEKSLNGQSNSNLHALRREAFDFLSKKGFPHAKDEEYKFTNLTKILEKKFTMTQSHNSSSLTKEQIGEVSIPSLDAYQIVFWNGEYSAEYSDDVFEDGLTVSSLKSSIKNEQSAIEAMFNSKVNFTEDPFVAMNTAFSQQGVHIQIADKAIITKPIVIYFIGDSSRSELIYNIRNLIRAGSFSQCSIIEKFDTFGENASFSNVVNEISVAENASFKHYKIENDSENANHISNTYASQAKHSNFTANTFATNGAMVRNNLNIKLEQEGCESHMNGLYLIDGKTHVDNHTVVDHMVANCYSNELYKGIMDGNSKGVFNGKIFVRQDAQQTNAFQSNKNILLSDKATINTKPQLEIWADDVKCSHGCTTGQLDEEALFYLQARGIQKDKARAILLNAFAGDVLENISIEAIQGYLQNIITQRLEG